MSTKSVRTLTVLVLVLLAASLVFSASALAKPAPRNTLSAASSASVTISVKSVTGRMVEGARVELFMDRTKFVGTSDANGVVTFAGVPYGTYYVGLSHQLLCDSYYKIAVGSPTVAFTAIAHPKSLWEGIGY